MVESSRGAYGTAISNTEVKRLQSWEYPHGVSTEILLNHKFKSLFDVGCGPNPALARFVHQQKAYYSGVDVGKTVQGDKEVTFVELLGTSLVAERIPYKLEVCDARKLSRSWPISDLAHMRFLLMHLSDADRLKVLKQVAAKTKQTIVSLEWDWGTMQSSHNPGLMQEFLGAVFDLMHVVKAEPFIGQMTPQLFASVFSGNQIKIEHYLRPEGDYVFELLDLLDTFIPLARRFNEASLADRLLLLRPQIEHDLLTFTPAQIVAVEVSL